MPSAGESMGERAAREAEYMRAVAPEVEGFVRQVYDQARDNPSALTLALVLGFWAGATERATKRLGSPVLSQIMGESDVPVRVYVAALDSLAAAAAAGLDAVKAAASLLRALGLSKEDGGKWWGKATGEDGSERSWESASGSFSRTASTAQHGEDMLNLLREGGYTHKRWITRYDSRVRMTHANVDRDTIPLEENFTVGGASLRFPADPLSADIGEVINCRCVLMGVNFGSKYPEPGPENFR